jgi:hypothetical protein
VNMFGDNPIVSRATIAAINSAQVSISIRAKVPNMSLGFASILTAYFPPRLGIDLIPLGGILVL